MLLLLLVSAGGCDRGIPEAAKPWVDDWAALAERTPGFVVWESYRGDRWRIWYRDLDGSGLRRLTPDEEDRDHFAPHLSPDGRYLAYLSQESGTNAYRQTADADPVLRLHRMEDGRDTVLVEGARSYYEDRVAVWLDSRSLLYIAADGTTRRIDIETRKQKVVQRKEQREYGYLIDPTLRHATMGRPSFALYNEKARRVLPAKVRSGCQPYFSRDGRFGFWVAREGGPICRVDLRTSETADIIQRDDPSLPAPFSYVYFPMISAGQQLLAFGGSRGEHDHFRADYEIFVVPIDPEILMPIGPPVRYSFHPATDRFPDVFEAGAELGRHWGEVPFGLSLRPPDDGQWQWDFGDGTQALSKRGRHLYQEPGHYRVLARRAGVTLAGHVHVEPGGPPQPLRATVGYDHAEVRVLFDEPVTVDEASFRFERLGAPARIWLEPGSQIVVVRATGRIDEPDYLVIEGVRDTARTPHRMDRQRLFIEPHDWPSRRDEMLLTWSTGDREAVILDLAAGVEHIGEAVAHGRARLDHHWRMDVAGGHFTIAGHGGLSERMIRGGTFALELTLTPDRIDAEHPGVIAGMGWSSDDANFLLLQDRRQLVLKLRTDGTPEGGARIDLAEIPDPGPHHLIVTYTAGSLAAYLNGRQVVNDDGIGGTLEVWRTGVPLVVGAGPGGDLSWNGVVEGIVLYGHFVTPDEARRNAVAYAERREERVPVESARVLARRRALSRAPTPDEITPYLEGLVVHEYEVLEVREGEIGSELIRVAHYAVQAGAAQNVAASQEAEVLELRVEPFEGNPQVESIFLADDLEIDLDVPLYLDVGP
jgi:hypothetical protein